MLYIHIIYNDNNNNSDDNDNHNNSIIEAAVSFHNFKSQNLKLSVSNPKNKYVAYVSVLSQISNCQGLGRKNKHEILKTDRKAIFHTKNCQTNNDDNDNDSNSIIEAG